MPDLDCPLDDSESLEESSEDVIRQLRAEAQGDRPTTAEQRRRASRLPRIDGHVKPARAPLKPKVIDKMRRDDRWPPDLALVDVLLVSLLAGSEDMTQWSEDVRRAVTVWRAARAEDRRLLLRAHPNAKEQLDAGSRVLKERLIHRFVRRRRGDRIDDSARETLELPAIEMRYIAKRQQLLAIAEQQDGPRRRGRRAIPKRRSVIDGWRWRDGRPREDDVPTLLLRVEVWRNVRAQVRPDAGPVPRAEALAEVLVSDLKTGDPATYKWIESKRRDFEHEKRLHYAEEEESSSSTRALTRAVRKVIGAPFRSLEARLSQALTHYPPSTHADVSRARRPH